MASVYFRRFVAVGLLLGLILFVAAMAANWIDSYADGQSEIRDKRAELRGLRDLAQARTEFGRLVSKSGKTTPILPASGDAQGDLATTIGHAADGQQVVIDSVEPIPSADPALVLVGVHLRGTQSGVYGFLRALEDQTPYLLVPRLELTLERAADPDRNKPLILTSDLHVAALIAPPLPSKTPTAPAGDPAP